MAGKNTYRIGSDGNANFPDLVSIPASILTQQDTSFLIYPGTYTAPTNVVYDDVAFVGVGDREEIVINGTLTIANTSATSALFENLTFVGPNAAAGSGSACVVKLGAASMPLKFERVTMSGADYGVMHHGTGTFATTTRQVTLNYSDLSTVDRAVYANANVSISFASLNNSANAYFTPGTGAPSVPVVTVRASTSAGSNTGNSIKSVLAMVV